MSSESFQVLRSRQLRQGSATVQPVSSSIVHPHRHPDSQRHVPRAQAGCQLLPSPPVPTQVSPVQAETVAHDARTVPRHSLNEIPSKPRQRGVLSYYSTLFTFQSNVLSLALVRHRTSKAYIQRYEPGTFGPPIVTTGPPLREQWINPGTKKRLIYSNAEVIWRSNARTVGWGKNNERVFYKDDPDISGQQHAHLKGRNIARPSKVLDNLDAGINLTNHEARRMTRNNSRRSLRTPGAPYRAPVPLPTPTTPPTLLEPLTTHISMAQTPPSQVPKIHHDLCLKHPQESRYPCVHWNILYPPHTYAVRNNVCFDSCPTQGNVYRCFVSTVDFHASATKPCSQKARIHIDLPELQFWMRKSNWGPIRARNLTNGIHVTVSDVLSAIYEYFRIPLVEDDLACVQGQWRRTLQEARERRVRCTEALGVQCALGCRSGVVTRTEFVRADLLNGNTHFRGLYFDERGRTDRMVLVLSG
ncbi:hypothetical protein GYMLUDRAFT_46132 [Collybiopsis luxurians FD-317 M1]|uniref:DUF6699 domain-containing protein n=1 Tax=Collybiopsis luxurians FD-317 M1 TaxID=944289 RepID=A0A0D0CH74_9AGAR|nr:hypothetical protein GYMLUDRAFT_46132 [Collybiopsis luxurians FD-317 M1]